MGVVTSRALRHEVSTVRWVAHVTRNVAHLQPTSVPLTNPWAER
ncbi:hypothetical protein J2S48_002133 [Promicromonospora iranensis]|uniref:Transposase n=1 Tax=Promicromonospora iranensis TaxID=1105144 RepID=A0ABU2CMS3_9MICO|nr:hypothetical protein [Promicromonospora iranensis]